jgi:HSP20 family protein
MSLVRWEPLRELSGLQSEMNRLFDSFFSEGEGNGSRARRWVPAMDLVEHDDHYTLRADLPGLSEDDVAIEVDGGVLTVSGERRHEQQVEQGRFTRLERSTGRFSRSLSLPEGVDAEAVTASFDRGVLEVHVPKPEQRKPRRVEIQR